MNVHDVSLLQCPESGAALAFHGTNVELQIQDGVLICAETGTAWTVELGLANLVRRRWALGSEGAVAEKLDKAPRFIEPAFAAMSLMLGAGRAATFRQKVVEKLELDQLAGQARARVLEIGMGTGANLEPVLDNAPDETIVEFWGTELSAGAAVVSRERVEVNPQWSQRVSQFLAASHKLPFKDGIFDRVMLVGGVDCLTDRKASLAEAARVCAPGGFVMLVDKQPDAADGPGVLAKVMLKRLAAATSHPQAAPLDDVPPGAEVLENSQLTPVHYCLRFRPAPR